MFPVTNGESVGPSEEFSPIVSMLKNGLDSISELEPSQNTNGEEWAVLRSIFLEVSKICRSHSNPTLENYRKVKLYFIESKGIGH